MLHSLKIENFKRFHELKFEKFQRVNLLTGRNNVGKTAVLEAMVRAPIMPGAPADLLVTGRNPLDDLHALDELLLVVRGGAVAYAR